MEDVYFTPFYKINAQVGNSQLVAHQASSEYIYEDNECSNRIPSCNYHADGDEYALPPQDREDTPEKRPRTEKKGNIQNIYDEGHYSLARNSGFDKDFSKSVLRTTSTKSEQQVEQKMLKRSHLIIICVIIIVFSIGGILSYVLIDQIGKTAITIPSTRSPSTQSATRATSSPPIGTIKFNVMKTVPQWICDDGGSGAWRDFTCYEPTRSSRLLDTNYTVGHFGINDNYKGSKPVVYQLSVTGRNANNVFERPTGFSKIWEDHGAGGRIDWGIWEVKCPSGYGALSDVCVNGHHSPSTNAIVCIKDIYLEYELRDKWIWDDKLSGAYADCDINGGNVIHTKALVTATNRRSSKRTLRKIKEIYLRE